MTLSPFWENIVLLATLTLLPSQATVSGRATTPLRESPSL